jgi:cell wall-associated NlpC family hydrolase
MGSAAAGCDSLARGEDQANQEGGGRRRGKTVWVWVRADSLAARHPPAGAAEDEVAAAMARWRRRRKIWGRRNGRGEMGLM